MPKFDLHRLNQDYFDRLRNRVIAARDRGIYVAIMLFEGWPLTFVDATWRTQGHPMHASNNINSINGNPDGDTYMEETMESPLPSGVWAIQQAYIEKVVDTVNDLDNVLYEVANEAIASNAGVQWQYDVIAKINAYQAGKAKQHPVGMTFQTDAINGYSAHSVLFDSDADWISPGRGAPDGETYRTDPPVANGAKVVINDTDHLWGIGGDRTWVWKSFLRGLNPIYMDDLESDPRKEDARKAMGHTLAYANRMALAAMTPRPELASVGYCLADPGREYLVYLPPRQRHSIPAVGGFFRSVVTVDLSAASGTFQVEWFDPRIGATIADETVTGGAPRSFTAPFGGDAVLYLRIR
jgi:hypothetical protein